MEIYIYLPFKFINLCIHSASQPTSTMHRRFTTMGNSSGKIWPRGQANPLQSASVTGFCYLIPPLKYISLTHSCIKPLLTFVPFHIPFSSAFCLQPSPLPLSVTFPHLQNTVLFFQVQSLTPSLLTFISLNLPLMNFPQPPIINNM